MYGCGTEHKIGDLVEVVQGFHHNNDERIGKMAVIAYTYASEYGGSNHSSIGLCFEDGRTSSWWGASKLKFIDRDKLNLAEQWKSAAKFRDERVSDLDFIFKNLNEVIEKKYTASLQSVFTLLGGGGLWGINGEGFIFYENCYKTFLLLNEFNNSSELKNKESFLEFCNKYLVKGETNE